MKWKYEKARYNILCQLMVENVTRKKIFIIFKFFDKNGRKYTNCIMNFYIYILKYQKAKIFPLLRFVKKKKKKCRIELKLRRYILESFVHYIPTKHFKKSLSIKKKVRFNEILKGNLDRIPSTFIICFLHD